MIHVLASVALSIDGFMDDVSPERLILSSPEDMREVYRLRATVDAVIVGANTVRRDDPSLVTTHEDDLAFRHARNLPSDPIKVTRTRSGNISLERRFFARGGGPKLIFADHAVADELRRRLGSSAEVIPSAGDPIAILSELERRGVERVMVEGGAETLHDFLEAGLVDELRLARAPRMLGPDGRARFDGGPPSRPSLARREAFGDTTVTWYTFARSTS